jgi:hypothetical protein
MGIVLTDGFTGRLIFLSCSAGPAKIKVFSETFQYELSGKK